MTQEVVFAEVPFMAMTPEISGSELTIKYRDLEIILHNKDSIPLDSKGNPLEGSKGAEAVSYLDQLFDIDRSLKGATTEERYQKRQETSKVVLEAFWSWLEETAKLNNLKYSNT